MQLNRNTSSQPFYPEKIIQFGEGNFLRAFIDWQFDILNEYTDFNSGITIVRPIDTTHLKLDSQQGLYTTLIRGINEEGENVFQPRVITSVNRELLSYGEYDKVLQIAENPDLEWVVSNTTEAGIIYNEKDTLDSFPPVSFPAKLTQFLYRRYKYFNGCNTKGLIHLPCELIDENGEKLREIILKYANLWKLEKNFSEWILNANTFCSTLVDRIVTGNPKEELDKIEMELGYKDNFLVAAEYFYLFVIQGPDWLKEKLKLDQCSLNIKVVDDIKPYKERKVGILNGAHTAMVPISYLSGLNTVFEAMEDKDVFNFIEKLIDIEIIPSLSMNKDDLISFKESVLLRFKNPNIKHYLISISLNSMTKFKTRLLPQLITYINNKGKVPKYITFSLAALYCFYLGKRGDEDIPISDDEQFIENFLRWRNNKERQEENINEFLSMKSHWECDLTQLLNFESLMVTYVKQIQNFGMKEAMKNI